MKSVTITLNFKGCLDLCPYASGADSPMSPIYCTLADRRVVGYSTKSCEIPDGEDYPPWCPLPEVSQ